MDFTVKTPVPQLSNLKTLQKKKVHTYIVYFVSDQSLNALLKSGQQKILMIFGWCQPAYKPSLHCFPLYRNTHKHVEQSW